MRKQIRGEIVAIMLVAALAGCGGGGDSSPPPSSSQPPPATPPPPPPPPPSPGVVIPPLSTTVVDITDNHAIGAAHWSSGDTADGGQGSPVQGLECFDNLSEIYHVHSHLSIFLNGEQLQVPGQVGIVPTGTSTHCHYNIHTHDGSGKIHVEAAASGTFTVGNLFAIWGQSLTSSNVAGLTGMPVRVFVTDNNGTVTESTSDWDKIELKSHREVTIQVGTDITAVPNITWNGN
jgi:predicted small lipoprotein YifL